MFKLAYIPKTILSPLYRANDLLVFKTADLTELN